MAANFDGVEIHSSNGYLLHQFFSRTSNVREEFDQKKKDMEL
jgi:N-ethylmaleimide reductase